MHKRTLSELDPSNNGWNIEQLQTYFAYVKTLNPELSKDSCRCVYLGY